MKSPFTNRLNSRFISSGLLVLQAFLGPIALQEVSAMHPKFKTGYAAQARENSIDAAEVYAKTKDAIVRIETGSGTGSGVIIRQDGLIVTNAHVVANSDSVKVKLANGRQVQAKVISMGKSGCVDLALLQLSGVQDLPTLKMAPLQSVMPGQSVVAIGFPLGMTSASVTQGIVSNIHADQGWVQHDAPINGGNSGGALVNSQSELIGINTMKMNGREGMGFAASTNQVQSLVQAAQNHLSPTLAAYVRLKSGEALPLVPDRSTIEGRLQSNDQQMCSDNSAADLYTFKGTANQSVIFEMTGESMNPYMVLLGPDGRRVAVTPAEGNKKTQRLYSALPLSGTYTVIANSQKADQFGRYTLRAITPILLRSGELGSGDPTLKDGSPYRSYYFSGKAKQAVQVSVSSQGFQPFVILLNAQNKVMWHGKFQSGENLNLELPEAGDYQVLISTVNSQESGHFAVTIESKVIAQNSFATPEVAQH